MLVSAFETTWPVLAAAWAGAAAVSASFLMVGGLRDPVGDATARTGTAPAMPSFDPPRATGSAPNVQTIDLGAAIRDAAAALAPLARSLQVRLSLAVADGLTVNGGRAETAGIVRAVLELAVQASAGGTVLATLSRVGGRRQFVVLADGCIAIEALESRLRPSARAVAMRGGTLDVEQLPGGEGARIVVRLPQPAIRREEAPAEAEPAELSPVEPPRELALGRVAWSDGFPG